MSRVSAFDRTTSRVSEHQVLVLNIYKCDAHIHMGQQYSIYNLSVVSRVCNKVCFAIDSGIYRGEIRDYVKYDDILSSRYQKHVD